MYFISLIFLFVLFQCRKKEEKILPNNFEGSLRLETEKDIMLVVTCNKIRTLVFVRGYYLCDFKIKIAVHSDFMLKNLFRHFFGQYAMNILVIDSYFKNNAKTVLNYKLDHRGCQKL